MPTDHASCAAHETETRETETATVGCSAVLSLHAVANRFTTNGTRTKQLVELAIADQFGDAHPSLGPVVAPAYKLAFDLHRRPVGPSLLNGRPYLRSALFTAATFRDRSPAGLTQMFGTESCAVSASSASSSSDVTMWWWNAFPAAVRACDKHARVEG
jgi:hypothetical protein